MSDERCLVELREAVRALAGVDGLLASREGTGAAPDIEALVTLEAARTARTHAANLVMLLTERALRHGASLGSLGFQLDLD